MELSLAFFVGNVAAITAAVRAGEGTPRDNPDIVHEYADFSLHLVPRDLDLLSEAIGAHGFEAVRPLRPSLTPVIDEAEYGLLAVDDEWVRYVALSPADPPENTAEAWAVAMRAAHNEPHLTVTKDMIRSVADLRRLCSRAHYEQRPVLHGWAL